MLLLLLFHCHFFSCLFYLVAAEEARYESTWFAVTQAAKPGHGSADTLARWLFAFYWAVVTFATIGYGDIAPVSNRECVSLRSMRALALTRAAPRRVSDTLSPSCSFY